MNKIKSSFRDPSGFTFKKDNTLFRQINKCYKEDYDLLMQSGLYQKLVSKKYLIPHEEISSLNANETDYYKIIKPQFIDFITYPYEWSFSMLKDAALLTLKIQFIALEYGMSLKDASAYNMQFVDGKPIFIDTLSFEKFKEGEPWIAYKQFCQHFLSPLILMAYKDLRLAQLLITNIDGISLDLANKLLPLNAKIKPSIFFNICLQSKFQKKYEKKDINFKKKANISKSQIIVINKQLQDFVKSLSFPKSETEWGEYYTFTNYNDKAFNNKKMIIENFLHKIKPAFLWDLGANNGLFTRIASNKGIKSISFDIDPVACEKNYNQIKKEKEQNILPVLFDLTNPSPSIGWANQERDSLSERNKPDVIMALALIHHIAISNNVPLDKIAQYFSSLSRFLIIEFVPKEDSKVQKLLATRKDIFSDYNIQGFEVGFSKYYNILYKESINNESNRLLYLMEKINE